MGLFPDRPQQEQKNATNPGTASNSPGCNPRGQQAPTNSPPRLPTNLGALLDLTLGASDVDHPLLLVLEAKLSLAPGKPEAGTLGAPDILAGLPQPGTERPVDGRGSVS